MEKESKKQTKKENKKGGAVPLWRKYLPLLISPVLTAAAVLYVFSRQGLYPFGSRTASWCDMNQQVVPLLCQFKDILDGKSGMFFSLKNASGMNFWGVFFFFLASPFTLLVKFVEKENMLTFMDILIVLKMMTCAFTATLYFTRSAEHKGLDGISRTMLGFVYAMSGYTMLFYQNIIWLDVMYLFPLLLLSLDRMKRRGSPVAYAVVLALMMCVNYYIGYMIVLFLLLTAGLCAAYSIKGGAIRARFMRSFITGSAAAALLSAVVWLPCFVQYLSSGRRGDLLENLRTEHFITDYDTVFPVMMCCSALIILAVMDLFRHGERSAQHKLTIIMAGLTVIPLFIEPVNKMWHTGSYMAFPARYAFMTIFMLMILSAYELGVVTPYAGNFKMYLIGGGSCAVLLIAYMLSASDYIEDFGETLSDYTRNLGGTEGSFKGLGKLFIMSSIVALAVIFCYRRGYIFREIFVVLLAGVVVLEGVNNTRIYMTFSAERNEATNSAQQQVLKLGGQISDDSFYRVKTNTKIFDYNTIGAMGYDSIAHYTSLTSEDYMFTMKRMGYTSVWMEVGSSGGTELTDALLSIGYRISNEPEENSIYNDMGYHIAPLDNKLPMGFIPAGEPGADIPDGLDRAEVQSYIAEKVFGSKDIVTEYEPSEGRISTDKKGKRVIELGDVLTYRINVNGRQTLYFDCFDKLTNDLTEPIYNSFELAVGGKTISVNYPNSRENGVLKLGSFENEIVTIEVTAKKETAAASLGVFSVDTDALAAAVGSMNGSALREVKNGFEGTLKTDSTVTVLLSLPYDRGLRIYVNGTRVKAKQSLSAFTEFDVPEGESDIRVSFIPVGLIPGAVMSLLGAGLTIWLAVWQKIREKRKAPEKRPVTDTICRAALLTAGILVILGIYVIPAAINILFWKKE